MKDIPLAPKNAEDTRTSGPGGEPSMGTSITLSQPKVRAGGEPSMAPDMTGKALYYLEAVLSGAGESLTALPDFVINRAIDLGQLTGAISPEMDKDMLTRLFYSRQFEKTAPTGLPEWTGMGKYGVGENVGFQEAGPRMAEAVGAGAAAAVPVVGVGGRASQVMSAGRTATPEMIALLSRQRGVEAGEGLLKSTGRDVVTGLATQFAKDPTKMLKAEAAIGAGASAITEGADIVVPGSGTYVALSPAVAAAGIPLLAKSLIKLSPTARFVTWASQQPEVQGKLAEIQYRAKDAFGSVVAPGRDARASSKVQQKILDEMKQPDALVEAQKAADIQRRIKEVTDTELTLSPAEVSMSPNLGPEQARIESRMRGQTLIDNLTRKKENLSRLLRFRNKVFDEGEAAPSVILDAATGRVEVVRTKTGKQLTDINNSLTGMADTQTGALPTFAPGDAIDKGMSIRQQLMKMKQNARATSDAMASRMRIDKANPIGDAAVVKQQVLDDLKVAEGDITEEFLHPVVKKFINFNFAAKGRNGKMFFQDWKNFRGIVSDAKTTATSSEARQLAILQEKLDGIRFARSKVDDKFRQYADWYMNNVILPFEDAAVIKVTNLGPGSRPGKNIYNYQLPHEMVAKAFLKDSGTATTYMKLFGGDAEKMAAIRDTVLDEVGRYAVRDGRIDPTKLQNYVTKNREVLSKLLVPSKDGQPGEEYTSLYDQLTNVGKATDGLLARERSLRAREDVISKYALNKELSKVAGVPDNMVLEQVIDSAFKNPKLMYQLSRAARGAEDSNVLKAFKRAVVDRIIAPADMENPEQFGKFMVKNEAMLRNVLGEQHFDDLAVLNEGLRRVLATGLSGGGGVTASNFTDAFERITGITMQGASARYINVMEGRVSPRTTFVWLAGQALRANQSASLDRAFEKSMFDADFAKELTQATTGIGEVSLPQARRLAEKFLYYGIQDPSTSPSPNTMTIEIPGGDLPVSSEPAPEALPIEEAPPVAPVPGRQGSLQTPMFPSSMPRTNMAQAVPPPPQQPQAASPQGIEGTRYAALFPGDPLGAMAASGGIASLQG